jgi:hypothetical protein
VNVLARIALPPLLLAVFGIFHPHSLTTASAPWWMTIHVILLPVFPLLVAFVFVLVRGENGVLAWLARIAALVFAPFYLALDAIAGIGAGAVAVAAHTGSGASGVRALWNIGNAVGAVGAWSLFVAAVLTLAVLARSRPQWPLFAAGGLILLGGLFVFVSAHIFFPRGVLALVAVAIGAVLVELSTPARVPHAGATRSGG